jgi:DNA-binding PadR family transcriptional regulator
MVELLGFEGLCKTFKFYIDIDMSRSIYMAKGMLKLWMLKVISEEAVDGYHIIKKVGELTGKKPSTGSVYPLLKSMQNAGWIKGHKKGNKTTYEITEEGKEIIKKHEGMQNHYMQKIHESISLANNVFKDTDHCEFVDNLELLNPIAIEINRLISNGGNSEQIKKILSKATEDLKNLEKGE